jgi:hypothetical protein
MTADTVYRAQRRAGALYVLCTGVPVTSCPLGKNGQEGLENKTTSARWVLGASDPALLLGPLL